MDMQCCRKRTRAASDSDEPAGPPKQAVTVAAEPPVLHDAADFCVMQETPASVPAATTPPPKKGRRRRRTRGHWTRPRSFLPRNIADAVPHPSPSPSSADGDFVTVVSKAAQRRAKALEAAAVVTDPAVRAASTPLQPLQPAETAAVVDQPAAPIDTPAEDLRDIVIVCLRSVLQAVIEYLPEGLPLRDACLQAVNVPLNALHCK
ncbi:hypothetical protein MTO96_044129 [Rhipicephalus appendiculatus]